jgi:hypothetical protein
MKRFACMIGLVVLAATVAGCASTSITNSWVSPDAQPGMAFEKILVVFMDPNEATRRSAEDALVARIGADRAVASHTMFSAQEVQNAGDNEAADRRKIQAAGIDAAVTMRMVNSQEKLTYSPGMTYPSYYGGYYGMYGYGWGAAYSPGYMRSDTIVSVETNLYDVEGDELLWAGVTETFNPDDVAKMVNEIADTVVDNLRQRGLVTDGN